MMITGETHAPVPALCHYHDSHMTSFGERSRGLDMGNQRFIAVQPTPKILPYFLPTVRNSALRRYCEVP